MLLMDAAFCASFVIIDTVLVQTGGYGKEGNGSRGAGKQVGCCFCQDQARRMLFNHLASISAALWAYCHTMACGSWTLVLEAATQAAQQIPGNTGVHKSHCVIGRPEPCLDAVHLVDLRYLV